MSFPFTDLSGAKRRPVFVIKDLPGEDIYTLPGTSKQNKGAYAMSINQADFVNGPLPVDPAIRPSRILLPIKISSFAKPVH